MRVDVALPATGILGTFVPILQMEPRGATVAPVADRHWQSSIGCLHAFVQFPFNTHLLEWLSLPLCAFHKYVLG